MTAIPPSVGWQYAQAALANARDLLRAAELLLSHSHPGPARSLAISAREELGKYLQGVLFACGVSNETWLRKVKNLHKVKQASGVVVAAMPKVVDLSNLPAIAIPRGLAPDATLRSIGEQVL